MKSKSIEEIAREYINLNRTGKPDYFVGNFNVTAFAEAFHKQKMDEFKPICDSYYEDETKTVLVLEQWKPTHIVVCLPVDGSYVQVMTNKNGVITSNTYTLPSNG